MTEKRASGKTRKARAKPEADAPKVKHPSTLTLGAFPGETQEESMARVLIEPSLRNGAISRMFAARSIGQEVEGVDMDRAIKATSDLMATVRGGSLDPLTDMLAAQMVTLDSLFSFFVTRGDSNMNKSYLEAGRIYYTLAMKAQANCRVTAETLAKIKRGGKQHIQITHVHEGGMAQIAAGDVTNDRRQVEAATDAALPALLGHEPPGLTLPSPGDARAEAVPVARGQGNGPASGEH